MPTLPELWAELLASATEHVSGFTLRLFSSVHDLRLYAAVRLPQKQQSIVVEMPSSSRPRDLARISTRTFEASVADFPGLGMNRCAISIVLQDATYEDLFGLFCSDIEQSMGRAGSSADAVRAVVRCIQRWRRFVEHGRRYLTDEEMRGLFGELVILGRCIDRFGPETAVSAWQGSGGLRDFELPDFVVEAKTHQAATGASVRIGDPEQLEGSGMRLVYLAVVELALREAAGRTLKEVVETLDHALRENPGLLDDFRDRLAAWGYLSVESGRYTERFVVNDVRLFEVREGFPRIPAASVPSGVRDVQFSIPVSALAPYLVDSAFLIGVKSILENT